MPNGTSRRDTRGFTIIELLVVIGIIVVLLGILLPVVNSVRKSAQKADSSAEITKIATAIHNYYQDFRSFPGPLPDSNIYGFNSPTLASWTVTPSITGLTGMVTSSQNLVLGLIGGLSVTGTSGTPTFSYPNSTVTATNPGGLVTSGPQSLNVYSPQQYPPYFDAAPAELSNNGSGVYQSCANGIPSITSSTFAAIPEFLDHFSVPTPRSGGSTSGNAIVYLRARVGSTGLVDNMTFPSGPTAPGTMAPTSQYYSKELSPYWIGGSNATPTVPTPGTPFPSQPDVNSGNTVLYTTAASFFYNQALNDGITPRSKDTFILISAGYDGIYGTSDDIVYSN